MTKTVKILGIDPGNFGAIADFTQTFYKGTYMGQGEMSCSPMPVNQWKEKRKSKKSKTGYTKYGKKFSPAGTVDYIRNITASTNQVIAFLENPNTFARSKTDAGFLRYQIGVISGALLSVGATLVMIDPRKWQELVILPEDEVEDRTKKKRKNGTYPRDIKPTSDNAANRLFKDYPFENRIRQTHSRDIAKHLEGCKEAALIMTAGARIISSGNLDKFEKWGSLDHPEVKNPGMSAALKKELKRIGKL